MDKDLYTLPNNKKIRLFEIYKIGQMKDRGEYSHNIYSNRWIFQIVFNNGEIIDVEEPYYYAGWGDARNKLEKTRNDLIHAFENYKK